MMHHVFDDFLFDNVAYNIIHHLFSHYFECVANNDLPGDSWRVTGLHDLLVVCVYTIELGLEGRQVWRRPLNLSRYVFSHICAFVAETNDCDRLVSLGRGIVYVINPGGRVLVVRGGVAGTRQVQGRIFPIQ